mgnify:CR=1 FL=1
MQIAFLSEKLGVEISTNVISLKYDCIRDKYIEIEFGNFNLKVFTKERFFAILKIRKARQGG